jgi:hypothetical protein
MNNVYNIDIDIIKKNYFDGKLTLKQIASHYGCTPHVIKTRLNGAGYKLRLPAHIPKYSHNQSFFSVPNVTNSYWAGVIAADGCILRRRGHTDTLSLDTHYNDISQLERFKTDIQFTGKISKYKQMRSIRINNANNLSFALEKNFSIIPRKTKRLCPPNITDERLIKAFIVGYIDGDGCIRIRKTPSGYNQIVLCIVGTHKLLDWIKKWFDKWVPIVKSGIKFENKGSVFSYTVVGNRANKLLTELKKVDMIRLNRKWDKTNEYELGLVK